MGKVFLSHSSTDKWFVEPIADLLGKNNCVYDKYTFELGMKTIDEIFSNLDTTDLFVYFISDKALESPWVKDELNKAQDLLSESKLNQIFPIIIDPTITHNDKRIASFLRKEYNLQRVSSYQIAYRKIIQQVARFQYQQLHLSGQSYDAFYGRDEEIQHFKQRLDSVHMGCLKSAVISGVPGIGKKTYIIHALYNAKIVPDYYKPIVLSMSKNSNIEDLIFSISDAGFGEYSKSEILSITDMNEKINILVELLNQVQRYKEIIIVEDEECLITLNGEIRYWFYNALKRSDNGLAIIVSSSVNVDRINARKYPDVFFESIRELSKAEQMGVLRTYSQYQGLELSREDLLYFLDCLSGYPPQTLFCIDMICEKGLAFAKRNTSIIFEMPQQISSVVLEKCQEHCNKKSMQSILALIAKLEIAPSSLITKICELDKAYFDALLVLKKNSVCYSIGANGEYLRMNTFIENFVSRNEFEIDSAIEELMQQEMSAFNDAISANENLDVLDTAEFKYFIKENLKNGVFQSNNFLYSTVVLQTISDLYNEQKYKKVVELISRTKSSTRYQYFDDSVINMIQYYYCLCLSKNHDMDFEAQVQFFADKRKMVDYHYLKGFNFRCYGKFEKAEDEYYKVLTINNNHYSARRELVIVLLSLQDYEAALTLAKYNYYRNKDNLFSLQPYFECLINQHELNEKEQRDLEEMRDNIIRIHRVNPTPIYYQLMGKYEAFYNHDEEQGLRYIKQGLLQYRGYVYLLRDEFDIFRKTNNIDGMRTVLIELKEAVNDYEYKGIIVLREAILDSFEGKSQKSIIIKLREKGFSEKTIKNTLRKCVFRS